MLDCLSASIRNRPHIEPERARKPRLFDSSGRCRTVTKYIRINWGVKLRFGPRANFRAFLHVPRSLQYSPFLEFVKPALTRGRCAWEGQNHIDFGEQVQATPNQKLLGRG